MTQKNIKVSLPKNDVLYALKFFNSNSLIKNIKHNDKNVDIEITSQKNDIDIDDITNEITNLIINLMRNKLLKKYISKEYSEIYIDDEQNIYNYSVKIFKEKEVFIRDSIYKKVSNYIMSSNYINLDGFIKFRMKEFTKYISMIADIAVEEYIIKRDQEEFINALKYFIEVQDEKSNLIRIHIKDDGRFLLYDENGNKVNGIEDEDIISLAMQENLNPEDFLISTLITLCPKKIEIIDSLKDNSSKDIIDMIESIFDDKVNVIYHN